MGDSSRPPSESFKATLNKFKKFARDCADEAIRAAINVRKSATLKSSVKDKNLKVVNNPCGPKIAVDDKCKTNEDALKEDDGVVIDNECEAKSGESIISLITATSAVAMEKMHDAAKVLEEYSKDAARTAEESLANSATQIAQASENVSSAIKAKADQVATVAREKADYAAKTAVENVDLITKTAVEQAESMAVKINESIHSVSEMFKNTAAEQAEDVTTRNDSMHSVSEMFKDNVGPTNDECNDSLMNMLEKSDVSCTIIGDPSEDFAEACKIVCEFDEDSKVNAKKCEYACLAVNRLREEVLRTAKEISNKGEREKNDKRSIDG